MRISSRPLIRFYSFVSIAYSLLIRLWYVEFFFFVGNFVRMCIIGNLHFFRLKIIKLESDLDILV